MNHKVAGKAVLVSMHHVRGRTIVLCRRVEEAADDRMARWRWRVVVDDAHAKGALDANHGRDWEEEDEGTAKGAEQRGSDKVVKRNETIGERHQTQLPVVAHDRRPRPRRDAINKENVGGDRKVESAAAHVE